MDIAVHNLLDYALAIFELSFSDFDSISYLNFELRIISDSLAQSIVFQKIPLILIVVIEFVQMRLS